MTAGVIVERIKRTLIVTLNRPEARNALTPDAVTALAEALGVASNDRELRAVVLTGAGGDFCAGADGARGDEHAALGRALFGCDKPLLAMIDGAAIDFGADLALTCDLRVVTTDGYLQARAARSGPRLGGGAEILLPRLVGVARALAPLLLGDRMDARILEAHGLANDVVEPSELLDATLALAARIEAAPPFAYAAVRRAAHASSALWPPSLT